MLSDLERRVKILQCLSTSLTKIHSAKATVGGGYRPRVMKVLPTWRHVVDMSSTDHVKCASGYPPTREQVR